MYEVFDMLLQKSGLTAYKVAKETGITQTALSNWKSGKSIPTMKTLRKIADYFNVSLDFLMNGKDEDAPAYYLNDETAQVAQEIFQNKELRMLFDATRNAPAEDLQALYTMAMALKRKENGNDD